MFDFSLFQIKKIFNQKFGNHFSGEPPFWPSKGCASKNWHLKTAYDPTYLIQNPFLLQKWGCLQTTRTQEVKI